LEGFSLKKYFIPSLIVGLLLTCGQPLPAQTPQPTPQEQTRNTQETAPLPPLPMQLPPDLTSDEALTLIRLYWPLIVDWSINSDKLPTLANQSLTFLHNSQQIANGQSQDINNGSQAATDADAKIAAAEQHARDAELQADAAAQKAVEALAAEAKAKRDADALGNQIVWLKIGCVTLSITTVGLGAYVIGHAAHVF
jgi:hypothetical protein